ncbi:MAG: ABC transporter substrate-binding protein [Proteobacteria bacterium]|nr:ABC transporter substrate-binding protein [Pseudomonadota bacterium]
MAADRLRFGFIALADAAPLIVAVARGFFDAEGLQVELVREVSWATVRDKLGVGALDGAHMLAPMALATTASGEVSPLVAPLALNLNGPAVTLSSRLARSVGAGPGAEGLARLLARRRQEGSSPITLAVVHPYSTHNYLLRDWLARAGIDPDADVRLTVVAPSRMTELLTEGVVEGVCVTEPWGAAAVAAGAGVTAVRASQLWPRTPDKVFAVQAARAEADPARLQAVLRALLRAAAWAEAAENAGDLAVLLADPAYVGASGEVIQASLTDLVFHRDGANAPQPAHAEWLLRQMARWGHLSPAADIPTLARRVYRPDLHAKAAAALGLPPAEPLAHFGED